MFRKRVVPKCSVEMSPARQITTGGKEILRRGHVIAVLEGRNTSMDAMTTRAQTSIPASGQRTKTGSAAPRTLSGAYVKMRDIPFTEASLRHPRSAIIRISMLRALMRGLPPAALTALGLAMLIPLATSWVALPARAASHEKTESIVLVQEGRPLLPIVIPPGAGPHERRAAEILRSSVEKMSGAAIPIVERRKPGLKGGIVIGFPAKKLPRSLSSRAAELTDDGFMVATRGKSLYILSGGHKGSIYGVVHLLETSFGCRRYSPSVAVFPERKTLAAGPLHHAENPVNAFRVVHGELGRDSDYQDWQRLDLTEEVFGDGYYVHTLNRLVPWETYFEAHPEYYAWMNGKRIKDQICPSRPEVLEIAIAKLGAEMASQPDRKIWSVSQNDNPSYCQCYLCRKVIEEEGSPAGPVIRFVNAVAARFPDRIISTLAYEYSRQAPRVTRPAANVQIMLCTIELNRSLPIADDPSSRSFFTDIVDWGRITRNIYLWDYTVNFSHNVSPFPNLHVLQPNIQFFVRNGARQHFQQTNTAPGHEFAELKSYLLARLLWNPEIDAAAVTKEFLEGYYGAAAPWIQKYIDALRDALARSGTRLDIYEPPVTHAGDYLSRENVAAYNEMFDRAEAAASVDAAVLERVRTARLALQYAMLEIGKDDMFGPRGFYIEREGRYDLRPEMKRLLDDFHATCLRNGVETLSEAGLTPKDYYESALRFIDVQVEGNLAFKKPVAADPPPASKYSRGDLGKLTDGVRGAHDFRVHWLGWEGVDFDLTLDLGGATAPREVSLSTLYDPHSWILHPSRVTCSISADGSKFVEAGSKTVDGDQRKEDVIRGFSFPLAATGIRFIKLRIEGTKQLPNWHPSAGGASWVFVDEIVVR